ncbi:hypothetical protein ACFQ68_34165, partial [Amycolatopsis japonica]|uniref:hypothetical protein n=1 Tax=Amycolatopsis japonica TaxID=208439 RepID=UPI00366E9B69
MGVVEAGMVLGDLGSDVASAGSWLPHEDGVFGVVVTDHRLPDLETLKKALEAAGWNKSDEVRLFLCYQADLRKRAGEFAAALRVDVSFAVDQVLFGLDDEVGAPAARVGKLAFAADGTPLVDDLRDGGTGWIKKKPGGQEEEGTYTLTAPAEAPRLGLTKPVALGRWHLLSPKRWIEGARGRRRARAGLAMEPGWLIQAGDGVGVVEAGAVLGDTGSPAGLAGRWLRRERGVFAVVIPGNSVPDAKTVKKALRAAGWNGTDALRLFFFAQKGLAELAGRLNAQLKVQVSYPEEQVWFGNAGDYEKGRPAARVGQLEYIGGRLWLRLRKDGAGWIDKAAGGTEQPGTYVLTAPAQQPRLGLTRKLHLGRSIPAARGPVKPLVPANLVGWRPVQDETGQPIGPQSLKALLRQYPLLRATAPWLKDGDQRTNAQAKAETESPLVGTRLGELPRELLDMVWEQAALGAADEWLAHALNERDPFGRFLLKAAEVAERSGWLADPWVVKELRFEARAILQARLHHTGELSFVDERVFYSMLDGFVDAAVQAEPGALPLVRGTFYVAQGERRSLLSHLRRLRKNAAARVKLGLASYPPGAVAISAKDLQKRVAIRISEKPAGDPRIGTAEFSVRGQRLPGGLYGPEVFWNAGDPNWQWHDRLHDEALPALNGLPPEQRDALLRRAQGIVSVYNQDPSQFIGPESLKELYRGRYEAAVNIVAWVLHRHASDDRAFLFADRMAADLADDVGLRRRHGVLGTKSIPDPAWGSRKVTKTVEPGAESLVPSGAGHAADEMASVLADSVDLRTLAPGWLIQARDGVGVVEAGAVLGDVSSPAGSAGRWLQRERGAFALVIPGNSVPDVETVKKALKSAGWNGTDALRLFFSGQEDLAELAGQLDAELEVQISYPEEQVWFGNAGDYEKGRPAARVGKLEYIGDKLWLRLRKDGAGWIDRAPGGEKKPGTYVLTAPAQQPRLSLTQKLHLGPPIPAARGPVDPLVPRKLVGWRPVQDETGQPIGPQSLKEYLWQHPLLRAIVPGLSGGDQLSKEDEDFLFGTLIAETRLGQLPRELLYEVWGNMGEEVLNRAEKWLVRMLNKKDAFGGYFYTPEEMAKLSGWPVDDWFMRDLMYFARADMQVQVDYASGLLSEDDEDPFYSMLDGFVDAAVQADPGALPRVRGMVYVEQGGHRLGARRARQMAKARVKSRLAAYPPGAVAISAKDLLDRMIIRSSALPAGDNRIGTAKFRVDGQRLPGGLYGPKYFWALDDPRWGWNNQRTAAGTRLAELQPERRDALLRRARGVVNRYNLDPSEFVGPESLRELYEGRHGAVVELVAWDLYLHRSSVEADKAADATARNWADSVGLRRRHGVLGGKPIPAPAWGSRKVAKTVETAAETRAPSGAEMEFMLASSLGVRSEDSVLEPGRFVRVSDQVSRIRAGVLLGDAESEPGVAGRWLHRERGVFGVVIPGQGVPDVETVVEAMRAAGWNGTDAVRLFHGASPDLLELASNLKNQLEVRVSLPEGQVVFDAEGDHEAGRPAVRVTKIEYAIGEPRVRLLEGGKGWVDWEPGNTPKPGRYALTASAPRLGLVRLGPEADTLPAPAVPANAAGWRPLVFDPSEPRTWRDYLLKTDDLREGMVDLREGMAMRLLDEMPLWSKLPAELRIMISKHVGRDVRVPDEYVQAWLKSILDERAERSSYRYEYTEDAISGMSGGVVPRDVVRQLRGVARADWHERWTVHNGALTSLARGTVTEMMQGFVDAAVQAEPDALPSARGVLFVEAGVSRRWTSELRSLAKQVVKDRLNEYPSEAVPDKAEVLEKLLARLGFWIREVRRGDWRAGTVRFHVDGQRLLDGWYGPEGYDNVNDPKWEWHAALKSAREGLAKVDRGDPVFTRARRLVEKNNRDPLEFVGKALLLFRYRDRYEAAVEILAWFIRRYPERDVTAEKWFNRLFDAVGPRRREHNFGALSERDTQPGTVRKPGGLVPVNARVGIVKAGVVLGDLRSPVASAGTWLPREPGVFGVVIADHRVPDMETLVRALHDAGWNQKDPLRFFLCAQPGLRELAGQLDDQFDVRVSYPKEQVLFGVAGDYAAGRPAARVGTIEYTDDGFPLHTMQDDGEGWIDRQPGGEETPGEYVMTAPAEAPRLGLKRVVHLGPDAPSKPLIPAELEIPTGLEGWWPAKDGSEQQDLREYLWTFPLLRASVPWLSDGMPEMTQASELLKIFLAGRPLGQLPRKTQELLWKQVEQNEDQDKSLLAATPVRRLLRGSLDTVWQQVAQDRTLLIELNKALVKREAEHDLANTPLGNLPRAMLDMIWKEVELDLVDSIRKWVDSVKDKIRPVSGPSRLGGTLADLLHAGVTAPQTIEYLHTADQVAKASGWLVAPWEVDQLRGVARTSWQARPGDFGTLSSLDENVVVSMLYGFVDAAVQAPPSALPRVRGVFYIERDEHRLGAHEAYLLAERTVTARLAVYPSDEVAISAEKLLSQVTILSTELPEGDPRIGTAEFEVKDQRPPGGVYGPQFFWNVGNTLLGWRGRLQDADERLRDVDRNDAVFAEARDLVNRYILEPSQFTGPASLKERYAARYNAAVWIVAGNLANPDTAPDADRQAWDLADLVGLRHQDGVLGGETKKTSGSRPEPGWYEPLSKDVGRIRAGVLLGDAESKPGQAGRLLQHEEGVFGVVVTDHVVPDVDTVAKAIRDAGWNGTDNIRLFLCAQPGLAWLASELAVRLGVTVSYPRKQVLFGVDGDYEAKQPAARVGTYGLTDEGVPLLTVWGDGKGWIDSKPRGREDEDGTAYVLTAPAEAPRLGLKEVIALGPRTSSVVEEMVAWRPGKKSRTMRKFLLKRETVIPLIGTRVGDLPTELMEMVRQEVKRAPWAEANVGPWVDVIKDVMATGKYRFKARAIEGMSGKLVDWWVVGELRGLARAAWQGRLIESGKLTEFGGGVVGAMLRGFVDAAVGAQDRHRVLPSVHGVLYVAEDDLVSGADLVSRNAEQAIEDRLNKYPSGAVSVSPEELRDRVDVRIRALPKGDERIGTAVYGVRYQRPAGGLFGPAAYRAVGDQSSDLHFELQVANSLLTGVAPDDAVFTQARALVDEYNQEPSHVAGPDSLRSEHAARYDAAVRSVAAAIRGQGEAVARDLAARLAPSVGPRRQHGVLGGEDIDWGGAPEQDVLEPGWMVPVNDRVGIIEAGMVLGDPNSQIGLAARWLQREPGVFGVVITGDHVSAAAVRKALRQAGWNGKDAVRLFFSAQLGLPKLAMRLERMLEVRVSYPGEQLLFGVEGDHAAGRPAARVGKIKQLGGEPSLKEDGKGWIDREPGGETKPGVYVMTAPAETPRLGLEQAITVGSAPLFEPLTPGELELVGWRPAKDGTGPRNLRDRLREYPLLRGTVPWLSEAGPGRPLASKDLELLLADPSFEQLPPNLKTMVREQANPDKAQRLAQVNALQKKRAESQLVGTPLGNLPPELLHVVWDKAAEGLLDSAEEWLAEILNELKPDGSGYLFTDDEVAEKSGWLVDPAVVKKLRGLARADWHARLNESGQLSSFDHGVIEHILAGFTDAVLLGDPEATRSMQVERYVAEGTSSTWADEFRTRAKVAVQNRVWQYQGADLEDLAEVTDYVLAHVGIQTIELPAGDELINTVKVSAKGQRPPGGLYGPYTSEDVNDPNWDFHDEMMEAREILDGMDRGDVIFKLAHALLNRYSHQPSRSDDPNYLQSLHADRHQAAVEILAARIHSDRGHTEVAAYDELADELADSVGLLHFKGVLRGTAKPVFGLGASESANTVEDTSPGAETEPDSAVLSSQEDSADSESQGSQEEADPPQDRAPGTETQALPTIPRYFRGHRAQGIATQLSQTQTEAVDRIVESARSFAPKPLTTAEVADLTYAFANEAASFFGEGRVFTMGGRPIRIKVDELDWTKQEKASRTGTAKAATRASAGNVGASAGTETNPQVAAVFFIPAVPGMYGTGVFAAPSNVATRRRHDHDLGGSKLVSVSLPEQQTRSVKVPMTVLIEPEEHRSDDGKLNVKQPAAAEFSIPEGLREEGRAVPMPDALPPSATEALTVRTGSARKIFEQVLVRLGKLDKNSREVLREFLGTGSITTHLAGMAVSPHAGPEAGWVTSPALVRGGNPIRRILSSRSQKVQMRAVAREVAYLETIEDAEFSEHEVVSSSKNASSTTSRQAGFYYAGGVGLDYGLVTAGAGPGIGVGYRKSRTRDIAQNSELSVTRTYRDTVVRYRTVYDLQFRTPGRTTLTFTKGAEGTQWAQVDDARRAGLLPEENTGTTGKAQPGAPLPLNEASARLKKIMHESAKALPGPGRKRWRWRDAGLVTSFDDPKLKKGLSGKLERQFARSEAIDSVMAEDNLARRLPTLLSERSQFLELAAEPGWGHDYRTGFQLDARLLAPLGEPLGPVKGGAGTPTVNEVGRLGDAAETGMELTSGFRARVYGALGASTALLSYTFKFFVKRTRATERSRGTQLGAGGVAGRELDESGAVVPEPKYRYAAKVELKVSGSHYARYNELGRGLTFGKRGKHVPDSFQLPIIDSEAAADGRVPHTILTDVVLELTEAERAALEAVSEVEGTRLPSKPLNDADYLRAGTSRVLDGIPVLAVSGLDEVRRRVKRTLKRASGDPIWKFRDGDNSALIEHAISVEALRSDPRAFNRPTRIDGLRWKRRKATATGAVGVAYRLRDPEVLDTFWYQPQPSAGATTSTSSENDGAWGIKNELEPAAFGVSEGSAHPAGSVMRGVMPVLVDWKFWGFTKGKKKSRKTEVTTTTTQKLKPQRVHWVRATLGATVSAEAGRRGGIDRWHFRKTRPPKTAAYRLDRAGVVWVLLTDEQLHEVRIQQAAEDARRGVQVPLPKAPELAERTEDVPEGHTLGGSNWADGISEPVDLSGLLDRADGLYERLEKALTKETVEQLKNSRSSDTGLPNDEVIRTFLSDFQASMPDVANGGVSATLRLENRFTGKNYDLIVKARPNSAPKPVGVVHGTLTKATLGSHWAAKTRSVSRTLLEMMTNPGVAMMFQSESEAQEAQREPGRHGAPAGTLGYSVAHVVDWLTQFRNRTNARTANVTQAEAVSGALAERSVGLDFDISFERHGERIADIAAERTVRTRSAMEDQGTGDGELSRGTVIRRLESEATEDRIGEWRKAAGAARLPEDPADFRIVHFDGEVEALRNAARGVLERLLGKKLDSRTWAMVRDQITPSQLKALAPSHFGNGSASSLPAEAALPEKDGSTGTELILPTELGVKLTLHAMLDGPGSLEGASARIALGGHTDVTRDKEFSGGSETTNVALTLPIVGAGVPQAPGHTTYEEGRRLFGSGSALFFGIEPHGAIAGGDEYQGALNSGGQALAVPGAPAAQDPITGVFSYPSRFRVVGESLSAGPLARQTKQVADVDYHKGFHVRRKDQNDRLPPSLKAAALALAAADREWTEAREKGRALRAKNPSITETTFEQRAAVDFWNAKAVYDNALASAQADPALHGGQRMVRLEIPPNTIGVPVTHWMPLVKVVRRQLTAHFDGRSPRVHYRVIGDPTTAVRDFNDLVMARLDVFADQYQVSVPKQVRLGRHQLGLAAAPKVVPGTGPTVVEIWVDKNPEGYLPTLPMIVESDESDSDSDGGTVVENDEGGFTTESTYVDGSFRESLPEYARDGKALGLVVVTEVKDREKVGKTITELLSPFGTPEPEGIHAIEGKLNRARFETFLGTKPTTGKKPQPPRGGRSFQVRVGDKWFEVHVAAVMDLDGATPGQGRPEPSRAVRELREQQVFGHSQSKAENSSYRLGLSSVSMTTAGLPVIAGAGVGLARPVGVRSADNSSNTQTIWRPHSKAQSAKVPVKYYITITSEDGGNVRGGTTDGEVGLLLSDSVANITKPDGVSAGKPNRGWEKRMGYVAVDAVLFDERALFDKLRRKLHPSVTKLQAPGWAALREFVSSANVRTLSRRMWRGEAPTSADLVSPHGAYREAARMDFWPKDVEFVGVVPDEGESRTQDTVTDEESVAYTSKAGPDVLFGVGYGAGLPTVAAAYGGAIGNVNAGLSDTAVRGRSVTTGNSTYVQGDVGLYRVTGKIKARTSHGERVTVPATKYVRLDLHEAAAENLPVPPGYEKRFVDVGPRFEPPYLAAAAAGGQVRAGVTDVASAILPRIEKALRRAPGLEDLLPKWSSREEKTVRGSGDKMERRLSNQRKLASVFSATALMSRLDSLLGPGVSTTLKRRGFFYDEFISVRVKATVDKGEHLGQADGRTVVGLETTGATLADSEAMGHGLGLGPEARGRVGPGGSDLDGTINAAASPVKLSVGRSVKNAGGSGSAVTVEQVGDGRAQVFAHGITFEIEIVSHRRPRRWVRRLTPGSPWRSIPKLRFLAGSRPGAAVHISPVTGKTELWVNDSAVYETDPSEFAPGPTTVVHLDPEETPSIDELAASAKPAPEFLYVEAFANAGELAELAVELSNRATNDDEVLVLPGSKGHQAVHQWFAPETLRALLKPLSKPAFRRNGLSYGRRATKRIGALGMQLELTEPVVVKISDVSRDKKTFSGMTKAASEHIRLMGLGPAVSASLFTPEPTAADTAAGRIALAGSAKFWGRKRVRVSEQTIKAEHKAKSSDHSRTVLVRYDVRSRMVAESRLKSVVDGAVSVAGADKFMPGSLFVRMSERQARAQGLLPAAERRAAMPGLGAPELAFGSSGSLGAYVAEDLPDLSSLLPALRAGLDGEHRDLIPESVLEDPMGTAERLGELVDDTNAASLLDNALDGGLPLRVHKPGTLWSDDYNVVLKATVETAEFDGYVNDGSEIEQTLADATPGKAVEERSRSWGGLVRLGWRSLFPTDVPHSKGALGGSGGLSGTRERADRRVAGSGQTMIRATTGSGPGARYRVRLKWELKIEREGREVASSAVSNHITIRTNADDQKVGGAGGPTHRSVTIPLGRHTEESVKEWQSKGKKLPVGVRMEGFRGAADIRDGAVQAIKSAGAKAGLTDSETGAMNTLALSVTNSGIRANLGKTSAGSLPLPELYSMSLIGGQVAKVKIYSRLSGAQIAGLSDSVRFDQSATNLDSFTADTAHSGSSGTTPVGGDGGVVDRAGNLNMPGGAGPQTATASGQLSGATAGLRSVTLQDTGRSGLTRFDTEHLIVADVDGVTSAVIVQLPASVLPRAINADLATVLGTPLPKSAAQAQDRVTQAGALWRDKESILHRKQGIADQKWFDQRAAEQRVREAAGVPGEIGLDPRVATLRATGTRNSEIAQEEARLDAANEELAKARAELTEAARAADVALTAWLRAKEALEAELAKVNAGLRPPVSLPGWVRETAAWAREVLEKRQVPAGLTEDARQALSAHFPELDTTAPVWEILHTILTAERVGHHIARESAANAQRLLNELARALADSVEVPGALRVGARLSDSATESTGTFLRDAGDSDSDSVASDDGGQTFLDSDSESGSSVSDPDVGRARVTFNGRLENGYLTSDDQLAITLMVQGFVDAVVASRPGAEPSLVGGVYVSPDTPAAVADRVVSFVKAAARARLDEYREGAAGISAEEIEGLIRVSAMKPASDGSPADTVQLQVRGQRPVKGLFGPEVFNTDPTNPLPRRARALREAREALKWLEDSDPVFAGAREIVNRYNQAPRPTKAWVDRLHRARYRAAVDLVALRLLRDSSDDGLVAADRLARALVSEVMWPRERRGVPGGVRPEHSQARWGDSDQGSSSGVGFQPDGQPVVSGSSRALVPEGDSGRVLSDWTKRRLSEEERSERPDKQHRFEMLPPQDELSLGEPTDLDFFAEGWLVDVLSEGQSGPVVEGSGSVSEEGDEAGVDEVLETQVSGVEEMWQGERFEVLPPQDELSLGEPTDLDFFAEGWLVDVLSEGQ